MDNIKSAGFAFPGDVSLALNMTNVILRLCRRISRKGGIFRSLYKNEKAGTQEIFLRSGFNHIVNLFVNYINLLTKF